MGAWIPGTTEETGQESGWTVLEDHGDRLTLEFALSGFHLEAVDFDGKTLSRIQLPGHALQMASGMPELPSVTTTLAVPGRGRCRLEILDIATRTLKVDPIVPSVGHISRNIDPRSVAPVFGATYSEAGFWPSTVAVLERPFLLRGWRGVTLRLYPVRYDAGAGLIEIVERITVRVVTEGSGGINERSGPSAAITPAMASVIGQVFTNAPDRLPDVSTFDKSGPGTDTERMLIISPADLAGALKPFVTWKARRGIEAEILTLEQIGGSPADIQKAVSDQFHADPRLVYLILVGDREQTPPMTGIFDGSDTDSRYALLAGDDLYPDLLVSRISARTPQEVDRQIRKFIAYERDCATGSDADWYSRASGVASDEGVPADYERAESLRDELLAAGYSDVDRLYQGLGGSTGAIRTAVAQGRSLINYLGHGSGVSWDSVPFDLQDVAALNNGSRLPWVVDVSCFNGDFARPECLAEGWMRAGSAAEPAGAVAVLAATSVAPWTPPTVMQAEIIRLMAGRSEQTLGSLMISGLAAMLAEYEGVPVARQVVEQNVLFGDCSLQIRTRAPQEFQVFAPSTVHGAATNLELEIAGPAGSVAAVTSGENLLGMARISENGPTVITLDATPVGLETVTLTVTGTDMVPFVEEIPVALAATPVLDGPASRTAILGNYPNPFNPRTTIRFELDRESDVRLEVFDIAGRKVADLFAGTLHAGLNEVSWNGTDLLGRPSASGVYLARLVTPIGTDTARLMLSK